MGQLTKTDFGYQITRGHASWLFMVKGIPKYRIHKSKLTKSWWVHSYEQQDNEIANTNTLRDGIISCLAKEKLL